MFVLSSLMRFMQVLVMCLFALLSNAHAGTNVINVELGVNLGSAEQGSA